jgi:phage tail-like protein
LAQFSVNTHRFDPYKNFKFRIKWDGKYVAGITKVSPLKRSMEPIKWREGGDPSRHRLSPGTVNLEPITLERGVTHDVEFEAWANLVNHPGGDGGMSLKNFRKDMILELLNEAGQVAKAWQVYRCWVSEYVASSELDAAGNTVDLETIVVQHEGFERDTAVPEPTEV